MDRYVNWCFRRLAATMEVRYGCLIGQAEPGEGSVHDRAWSLGLDQLEAALDDPGFGSGRLGEIDAAAAPRPARHARR